jgi:hypothetical protein
LVKVLSQLLVEGCCRPKAGLEESKTCFGQLGSGGRGQQRNVNPDGLW